MPVKNEDLGTYRMVPRGPNFMSIGFYKENQEFRQLMAENFPKLAKDTNVHIHEVQQTPCRLKTQHTLGHHNLSGLNLKTNINIWRTTRANHMSRNTETMLRKWRSYAEFTVEDLYIQWMQPGWGFKWIWETPYRLHSKYWDLSSLQDFGRFWKL